MKRVLVMAFFYPPLAGGGVHRVLSFTRYLPAHGWACTVVCGGEHDYWVRDESLLGEVPAATEVLRVAGGSAMSAWLRTRGANAAGRRSGGAVAPLRSLAEWTLLPDGYAGWAKRAAAVARSRVARGDVHAILSSSPPDSAHLAARDVARACRLPWVADFRDPWIGLHFRRPPTAWHRARQQALEARVTGEADLVLAASRTHAEQLRARERGRPERLLELANGFEPAPADPARPDPAHFRLVFTGTLSLMEDVGTLLEAVERVAGKDAGARRELRVELVGPYDRDWEERARARGLAELVHFTGPLPHAEARARQRAADALLLWKPHGEGFRTMVPGKLYEYLDSGRPIVALLSAGDEAAEWVARAGGWVGPPGDSLALAAELESRLARWRREGRTPDARLPGLETRTRQALAGELAGALDALVGRP